MVKFVVFILLISSSLPVFAVPLRCEANGVVASVSGESFTPPTVSEVEDMGRRLCQESGHCVSGFATLNTLAGDVIGALSELHRTGISRIQGEVARIQENLDEARTRYGREFARRCEALAEGESQLLALRRAYAESRNAHSLCLDALSSANLQLSAAMGATSLAGLDLNALGAGRLYRPPSVRLAYPGRAWNSRFSGDYDRDRLFQIISAAIRNGADPFLAVAITMVESPSTATTYPTRPPEEPYLQTWGNMLQPTNFARRNYASSYGDIPADAIASADMLQCLAVDDVMSEADQRLVRRLSESHYAPARLARLNELEDRAHGGSFNRVVRALRDVATAGQFRTDYRGLESCPAEVRAAAVSVGDPNIRDEVVAAFCRSPSVLGLLAEAEAARSREREITDLLNNYSESERPRAFMELRCHRYRDCNYTLGETPARNVATVHLSPRVARYTARGNPVRVCASHPYVMTGAPLPFGLESKSAKYCCTSVTGTVGMSSEQVSRRFATALGARYLSQVIMGNVRRGSDAHSLAMAVQRYNGMGTMGATEQVNNDCLTGINMATHPIYGARVLELMATTVLPNPQIQQLVAEAAFIENADGSTPVKSVFCQQNGPGQVAVTGGVYLDMQRSFLLDSGVPGRGQRCQRFFQ